MISINDLVNEQIQTLSPNDKEAADSVDRIKRCINSLLMKHKDKLKKTYESRKQQQMQSYDEKLSSITHHNRQLSEQLDDA